MLCPCVELLSAWLGLSQVLLRPRDWLKNLILMTYKYLYISVRSTTWPVSRHKFAIQNLLGNMAAIHSSLHAPVISVFCCLWCSSMYTHYEWKWMDEQNRTNFWTSWAKQGQSRYTTGTCQMDFWEWGNTNEGTLKIERLHQFLTCLSALLLMMNFVLTFVLTYILLPCFCLPIICFCQRYLFVLRESVMWYYFIKNDKRKVFFPSLREVVTVSMVNYYCST